MVTSRPWRGDAPVAWAVMNGACGPWICQSSTSLTLACAVASAGEKRREQRARRTTGSQRAVTMRGPPGRRRSTPRALRCAVCPYLRRNLGPGSRTHEAQDVLRPERRGVDARAEGRQRVLDGGGEG